MVRLAVGASSAERRRVAGELHDGVIQDLAGVGYALSAVDGQLAALGTPFTAAQIGDLRGRLRTAQRLVIDDAVSLREVAGVEYAIDRGAADPVAALEKIAADLRDGGMKVEVGIGTVPALPAGHRAAPSGSAGRRCATRPSTPPAPRSCSAWAGTGIVSC